MDIKYKVIKLKNNSTEEIKDSVSVEEPLEMSLKFRTKGEWKEENLSITMRTPGQDEDESVPGAVHKFGLGATVLAKWQLGDDWYEADVKGHNPDGTYHLLYIDGDEDDNGVASDDEGGD